MRIEKTRTTTKKKQGQKTMMTAPSTEQKEKKNLSALQTENDETSRFLMYVTVVMGISLLLIIIVTRSCRCWDKGIERRAREKLVPALSFPEQISSAISCYLFRYSSRLLHLVVSFLPLPLFPVLSFSLSLLGQKNVCLCHDDIDFLRTSAGSSFFFLLLVVVRFGYGVDTVNSLLRPIVPLSRLTRTAAALASATAATAATTTTRDKSTMS